MRMGLVLEGYVLEAMVDEGWDILPAVQPEVGTLELYDGCVITGIVDAIGSHPEHCPTLGVIEVKTRSNQQFRMMKNLGNQEAHYGAVVQLAIYRRMAVDNGKVSEDSPGMIATLNKDTSELYVEYFSPRNMDIFMNQIEERIDSLLDSWQKEDEAGDVELIEPPIKLAPTHWRCVSCEWRTRCGNLPDEEQSPQEFIGGAMNYQEVVDALCQWEEEHLKELEHKPNKKIQDWAKGMMKAYAQERGYTKFDITGNMAAYVVNLQDRTSVTVNKEKVRYMLTPSQYEEVLEVKNSEPFITIRQSKKK